MHLDWSVNVIEMLTLIGLVAGLVWRAARLTAQLETLIEQFGEHVTEDDKRFTSLADQLHAVQLDAAARRGR